MPRFSIGIYHNGETAPFCSTSKLTQNESFMGQNFVSITIESPAAIGFKVGDYLTYRGRKFVLAVTPSMQKQARVNSVGNAIKYDNIKFISVASDELTRCEFRDVVNSTTDHYNFAARTFSFHCLTLKDYAERLKANLDRMYGGYTIKVLLDDGNTYTVGSSAPYNNNAVGEKNKVIQISNETCWDSLQHVKADFKVNLYFDGDRTIVLGANGHLIAQHHFAYGAGEGLFKISRTTDESQAIITRLRAYGSEKNMPTRFYANLKYLYLLPKEMIVEAKTSKTSIDLDKGTTDFENDGYLTIGFDGKMLANSNLSESNKFTSSANGAEKYLIKVRINNVSGWMNIQFNGADNTSYANIGWNNVSEYGNNTETSAKALVAEFCKMQWTYFVIEDGATETWKYKVTDPSCVIPNNMNVKCLMLAGFGFSGNSLRDEVKAVYDRPSTDANKKLIARLGYPTYADFSKDFALSNDPSDPYIDAVPQKEAYGVREGTVVFDGTTEGYDEIYPSIEYIGNVDTCPAQRGKVDGSDKYEDNNLRNDGGVIDDITEAGKEIPQFYLYIKDPSFNPYDYRKSGSDSFKINMIDGMCGGRSFDVKQAKRCTFEDGSVGYRLVCDRVEDNSLDLYFPYSQIRNGLEVGYIIKAGDRYTFSDIEMPSEYVLKTALYELFPAAVDALKKNRDVRFKYELNVDANEMHRQHLLSLSDKDTDSIHDTIHAGDLILFGDKDLGVNYDENEPNPITGSVIINSIEIKENNERLPQYSIRLVDEKTIGTIERIQRQIESIMNGSNGSGSISGYAASEIQRLIRTYGANYFLSKTNDDTAKGKITFDKGADFGKFVTGISGQGARIDNKGDAEFQNLRVWRSMTVTELRFDRASVLLGTNILTYCGGVIKKVEITGENSGYIDLETDEDANGEIAGGIGSIQNGALCVGYFHDIEGGNDIDDSDDFKGTIRYKGTKCVQFAIDWKEEGENGYNPADLPNPTTTKHIRYELREGTTQHPVEGMTFKGTGNMKDPSLGYFTISTPKYTAKYAFVTSWEWDAAQCVVEVGGADISGFGSIIGEDWTSPKQGTICTNLYTRGVINQVTTDKRYLYVTQDSNGMLKSGEREKITMVIRDSYFENRTKEFTFKFNGEPVKSDGNEAVTYVSFDELDNDVNEFVITATDGKKHLIEQTIKIRKLLDGMRLEAGKAAIGEELTASVLRYHGTTRVTNGYLWYEIDNGGLVSYTEGTEVRLASTNKKITFWWYEDEMRLKLIAKLELPVVKNGEDGKDGVDGESAYVIITDREVVKPDEESTLVYFDGFKAAVQWDGGAPVGVTNESIVVRACRCRGNKESNEGSFIYRLDGGEAHAMTNGGSVTVEKRSGIKSVTFCWLAENGATLAQKIVYVVLDGESPVFADLDNEMDSIVTDKDGNFEGSVVLSTNVAMFHGLTRLSPTITAASATGITSSVEGERVSFEVTQAAADRNEMDITLTAVIEDVTYTRHLTFTIVKQRKGNTGDPAVVYSLAPSYSAIKVDKYGNRVVKSIVCNVAKTTGKDESVLLDSLPEGMKVKWQMDDDSSVSESSTIPTINVSAVKNQLVLMLDYDGTIIDRETIPVMSDAVESFKEMVFKRQGSTPSKPSGGTFASPIPTGWSDGIPSGEEQVWTSSRTFYSDNRSTADWTDPVQLSDTADFDVCYHADEAKPTALPTSHHTEDQGNGWHNTATENDWWMATDIKKNGVWQGWKVSRIKGEKGNSFDEAKYYFTSTANKNSTPSVSLLNGVPQGWETSIAETKWGEKPQNDTFHYWLWQVVVETIVDNTGSKTYKAQSAQLIDEYDPKKTGVVESYCANNDANNHPTDPDGWVSLSSARANFGKDNPYLWKREVRTYSDNSTETFYTIFDKYVENGERGKRGRMLRPCGVWSASKTYVNNDDYVDAVIHNGKFYAVKEDSDGGNVSISGAAYSPDTSYWEEANMLEFVATSLFFAETAYVRNLALVDMIAGYYSGSDFVKMISIEDVKDSNGNVIRKQLVIGNGASSGKLIADNSGIRVSYGSDSIQISPYSISRGQLSITEDSIKIGDSKNRLEIQPNQVIVEDSSSGTSQTTIEKIIDAANGARIEVVSTIPSVTEANTLYIVK